MESLEDSVLANVLGINGLLFSNDGYIIVQKRLNSVLIRRGELCSGFSGTIDKQDIANSIFAGSKLGNMDVVREMVEEVGIDYSNVSSRCFLGITRELVRGGKPEMFYSVDVNLPSDMILQGYRKDKEGTIKRVHFGKFGCSTPSEYHRRKLPEQFWRLVGTIRERGKGSISLPLLTNLVLWYQHVCPKEVGMGEFPEGSLDCK